MIKKLFGIEHDPEHFFNKINELVDAVNNITDYPEGWKDPKITLSNSSPGLTVDVKEDFCLNGFKCELYESHGYGYLGEDDKLGCLGCSSKFFGGKIERCPCITKRREKKSRAEECVRDIQRDIIGSKLGGQMDGLLLAIIKKHYPE